MVRKRLRYWNVSSTWPSKRLAAEAWKLRLQPPLRSSLCDGSPNLWDGQPLPPEDGGRCCRGVPRPSPSWIMQILFVSSEKIQSIKVVRNDSLGPRQRHLCRQRFATCFAILMCLPRGQAKGWFVSSEKVPSIKVVRKDCIRPNLGNLYRQRVAKCLAIFMRSTWPSKRLAAEKWPPRLQPRLRVSLCDGSPDLWDGQPLPPEDGGRCCRGVPRPGPRLA